MWRFTSSPVRFFIVDARALVPLLLFILHIQWWTFYVAIVGVVLFGALEWAGLTAPVAWRTCRRLIVGPVRPCVPAWKKRRFA
jgi:intracellular multiplication protein IcmT